MIDLNNISIEGTSQDIIECLIVILATPQGTVPWDRDFGIDYSILDLPSAAAKSQIAVEFTRKVQKYEPRVKVKNVTFNVDSNNNLVPKVVVE